MRLTLLIAAGLIVGVGLSARAEDAMGVFQETSKAWETAYNAGKADSFAALYAEDATFITPQSKRRCAGMSCGADFAYWA